ncbi:MAG: hypothetical protein JSS81_28570 [Acidobacteria bacterium]|nr:hypothetical protein [Acidobacteriota bacterium]
MKRTSFFDNPLTIIALLFVLVFGSAGAACRWMAARALKGSEVPQDWKTIETDFFSVAVPPTMKKLDLRGIDSQVMGFENDEIRFVIEYGAYSTDVGFSLKYYEGESEPVVIDGKTVELISYNANKPLENPKGAVNADGRNASGPVEKPYVTGVQFPRDGLVFAPNRHLTASFIASYKTSEDRETAQTILASIKFKDK